MPDFGQRIADHWYPDRWNQGRAWLWLLWPLSAVFYAVTALRRLGYRRGLLASRRCPVPVIVVGNIAVGGTGKTPLVVALVETLRAHGYRPGIASRGYGGEPPRRPYSVGGDTRAEQCGDEPLMLARRTGVPVVVDRDRVAAALWLVEHHHCDIVISDDGLQHYRLQRDIEIAVIDGQRGLGNRRLLPMGPLREPVRRLHQVDFIVVNGTVTAPVVIPESIPATTAMGLRATQLVNLATAEAVPVAQWRGGPRVHAVAGIGNPARFFATLEGLGLTVIAHPFPDHHAFSAAELHFGDALPVIMTEKDAVKCQSQVAGPNYWFLRVDAELPAAFYTALLARLPAPRSAFAEETQ